MSIYLEFPRFVILYSHANDGTVDLMQAIVDLMQHYVEIKWLFNKSISTCFCCHGAKIEVKV